MGDLTGFNKPLANRHERIKQALFRLSVRRQAIPQGSEDAAEIYVSDLDASGYDTDTLVQACERLGKSPDESFERYKFPLVDDILSAAHSIEVTARGKLARVECAACDGMRMVVRRRADGGTHAIPCPVCTKTVEIR